jgi:hypothetical protein
MMDASALFSTVPDAVAIFLVLVIVVVGLLIFYALRHKGDVRAEFSHGSTIFKLEAKGRPPTRGRRR